MTWVFCAGMIRSGSTLQFQLASAILEKAGVGSRVPYAAEAEFEKVKHNFAGREAQLLVFKAHICTPALERECIESGAKVIYSYRDIRDVAVSSIRKFRKTLSQLLEEGWLDQAIADYYRWTAQPGSSVTRYEELHDVTGEARKINVCLGAPLQAGTVNELAQGYTLTEQRRRVEEIRKHNADRIFSGEQIFDPRELLHHNHIHAGESGGWRTLLSSDQQAVLNARYADWLCETGYEPS